MILSSETRKRDMVGLCRKRLSFASTSSSISQYFQTKWNMDWWEGKYTCCFDEKGNLLEDEGINKNIELWGDGSARRSFLYIDDFVETTIMLMKSDISDVLNIGSEDDLTVLNLLEKCCKSVGV